MSLALVLTTPNNGVLYVRHGTIDAMSGAHEETPRVPHGYREIFIGLKSYFVRDTPDNVEQILKDLEVSRA